MLSKVLAMQERPSSLLAYAAICIAKCYASDLLETRAFSIVFDLFQHPQSCIRNAMASAMAEALQGAEGENSTLCEDFVRAGFFQLVLNLLEQQEPTDEIIDCAVRDEGLELISLSVARHGGLREMWRLVESHPNTSVRAAATMGIERIVGASSESDKMLLTGGNPSVGTGDMSEKRFYLVSSVSHVVGNTSHVEPHIENLCQNSFSNLALQIANSDDMPQLVTFLK